MITWCSYAESDFNFSLSTWTFHSFILLNSSNRRDHPPILVHNTIYSTWRQLRFLYPTTFLPPLYLLLVPPSNISGDLILLRFSLYLSLLRCFTCTGETPLCHFSTIPESASPSIHPQRRLNSAKSTSMTTCLNRYILWVVIQTAVAEEELHSLFLLFTGTLEIPPRNHKDDEESSSFHIREYICIKRIEPL